MSQGPQFLDRLVDVSALVGLEDMATLAGSRQAFFPRGLGPKWNSKRRQVSMHM